MIKLIRTKSGPFDLSSAVEFENLTKEIIQNKILSLKTVLKDIESIEIYPQDFQRLLNGLNLDIKFLKTNPTNSKNLELNLQNYAVICQNEIVGIGLIENNNLKIKTYLTENFTNC